MGLLGEAWFNLLVLVHGLGTLEDVFAEVTKVQTDMLAVFLRRPFGSSKQVAIAVTYTLSSPLQGCCGGQ